MLIPFSFQGDKKLGLLTSFKKTLIFLKRISLKMACFTKQRHVPSVGIHPFLAGPFSVARGSLGRDVMVVLPERCFAALEPVGAVVTSLIFPKASSTLLCWFLVAQSTSVLPFPHLLSQSVSPRGKFLAVWSTKHAQALSFFL